MRILVIGGGGREHALCWALKKSPHTEQLFCIPGNAGIAELATCSRARLADIPAIVRYIRDNRIDLVVVGPEAPLVDGLADDLTKQGIKVFGPSREAAAIEGSKAFAKEFMRRHNIPTAAFRVFTDHTEAIRFTREFEGPVVIKADGLAAGKGVLLPESPSDAGAAIQKIMVERAFGEAGARVVVEQCISGEEVSVMAFSDGKSFATMVAARDHKRIYDGDRGPNTGGMGAYAPTRIIDEETMQQIVDTVIEPTVTGLRNEGRPFVGCLYAGLMMTEEGPRVLEFNCRFGDPETQVVLPLLQSDLVEVMMACVEGELDLERVEWSEDVAVCVILASRGYPGRYEKGLPINGLEQITDPDAIVFHAGTGLDNGRILTAGGRVLGITGLGETYDDAVRKAYDALEQVRFKGMQYRRDIGYKAGVNNQQRRPSSGGSSRFSRRRR
jgi:phosphoribosylamine--glycine ligase